MKKTHRVGGMWASLFAFFIFFRVLSSCSLLFLVCYGVRGRGKAMALQRNVVYTVTRWMDEWMDWWMDGWMMLKITDSHEQGLEQELDACLITVFIVSFFGLSLLSEKNKHLLCFFCPVVLEKKRGCIKNPCRHEDSPVLFCHFFPLFLLRLPLLFPPPRSLWSNFKAVGTRQSPLLRGFSSDSKLCDGRGEEKKTRWCLNENYPSGSISHASVKPCIHAQLL